MCSIFLQSKGQVCAFQSYFDCDRIFFRAKAIPPTLVPIPMASASSLGVPQRQSTAMQNLMEQLDKSTGIIALAVGSNKADKIGCS